MGFQGDVAGIGLGELLQGLARGGREGVLRLHSENLTSALGLQGGQIFLLPEPDEDPEIWRRRCERAWVREQDHRIDVLRMSEIAYAARLETVFCLLDAEGVHFRFEPGPLATKAGARGAGQEADAESGALGAVHCPGVSVEFLLLEYARMADECMRHGDSTRIAVEDVPRALDTEAGSQDLEKFWRECDGMSTVQEIGDRLGWPLRQLRALVQENLTAGTLRLSHARELLVLAQRELQENRFARAGARLSGWVRHSPGGPPPLGDAQLLINEWRQERLTHLLEAMPSREARVLLKRIDLVEAAPADSVARWKELRRKHRHDAIVEVRLIHRQLVDDSEPEIPSSTDLLKLARNMQDAGFNLRAGVMLRAAAARLPESTSARLELGTRLLEVGLVDDGAPWIVEASRTLIEGGYAEKAIAPLRALASAAPSHREARSLLALARGRSVRGRRKKRNSIVALSILLLISTVGLVRVHLEQEFQRRIGEITDHMNDPRRALALLDETFPDDSTERVQLLRATLVDRLRKGEYDQRNAWMDRFKEINQECTLGDPLRGLQRALEMPDPPRLELVTEDWPPVQDLMRSLVGRLGQNIDDWPDPRLDDAETVHAEQRMARLIGDLRNLVAERDAPLVTQGFSEDLTELEARLATRSEVRARKRQEEVRKERLQQQDILLAAARAHAQAGDLDRALDTYQRLIGLDETGKLEGILAGETDAVRQHQRAYVRARELATQGQHGDAYAALKGVCANPAEHLLPWRVETEPQGARVHLADGTTRVAPFVMESARGSPVELVFELTGHESLRLSVLEPGDRFVVLSRNAQRHWATEGSVDSLPVSVGDDHVLADRSGRLARLGAGGAVVWTRELDTLGGVARAPVFLPRKPGYLLVLTEDGDAWIVEAATGKLDGPWSFGSPPIEGPIVTENGVLVRFEDGRSAIWESRLRPTVREPVDLREDESPQEAARRRRQRAIAEGTIKGSDVGLAVLRRDSDTARVLRSPWNDWEVEVQKQSYRVRRRGGEESFGVRLEGQWAFVAWEAPHSKIPDGRLWISDSAGLRAFEP